MRILNRTAPSPEGSSPSDVTPFSEPFDLGRSMVRGAGWTVGARFAVLVIGTVSTIILARLLVPADFGLVALASAFSAALQAISEFSFDVALIQNQRAERRHYDTAWTLSILRNVIVAIALVVGARLIAASFGDARLVPIIYCLALATVLDGLQNIGIVNFRKELTFHRDFIFMVLGKLGSFVVTVPLALTWRNYWALVAGMVAGSFINTVLSFAMLEYRPRFTLACWQQLMHFSKWLVFSNVCSFIYGRSSTFILGKIVGEQEIGILGIAGQITSIVTGTFLAPLRRAIFPSYSKVTDDFGQLQRGFTDVTAIVFVIGAPLTLGIGLVADPLVRVMLGDRWIGAIPLIQVLAVGQFFQLITAAVDPIFLATGRPHYISIVTAGRTLLVVPMLIFAIERAGALGAAYAFLVVGMLTVICDFTLVIHLLHLPISRVLAGWWRPSLAVAAMTVAVFEVQYHWPISQSLSDLTFMLMAAIAVGAIVYAACELSLWLVVGRPRGAETQLFAAVKLAVEGLGKLAAQTAPDDRRNGD